MEASVAKDQEENERERVNRELIELLNELRVALPGVQVLFAFLLAVPFTSGWDTTTGLQRALFFATLMCTAIASCLLIAPSAYHRLNFRAHNKRRMLMHSNKLAIAGLAFLALAMIGAVVLITDFLYGDEATVWAAIAASILFGGLWAALPLWARREHAQAAGP